MAVESLDRETVAERTADADGVALADVVEEIVGQHAGPSNTELEAPPAGRRGGQRERGLADTEDRQLDELTGR